MPILGEAGYLEENLGRSSKPQPTSHQQSDCRANSPTLPHPTPLPHWGASPCGNQGQLTCIHGVLKQDWAPGRRHRRRPSQVKCVFSMLAEQSLQARHAHLLTRSALHTHTHTQSSGSWVLLPHYILKEVEVKERKVTHPTGSQGSQDPLFMPVSHLNSSMAFSTVFRTASPILSRT